MDAIDSLLSVSLSAGRSAEEWKYDATACRLRHCLVTGVMVVTGVVGRRDLARRDLARRRKDAIFGGFDYVCMYCILVVEMKSLGSVCLGGGRDKRGDVSCCLVEKAVARPWKEVRGKGREGKAGSIGSIGLTYRIVYYIAKLLFVS